MEGLELFQIKQWQPFTYLGFTHSFFTINAPTVINTWIALFFIALMVLPIRYILAKKTSTLRFALISSLASFADFTTQTLGMFSFAHFSFVGSLFIFIFLCNGLSLFPWLEEPTQDLNTTFALGIITFFYIQGYAIQSQGIKEYLKEYFQPFFIMFPLHVIGKLATVVSISFRLFGNIFGGATISHLYYSVIKSSLLLEIAGLLSTNLMITLFFGLFEGFLQAFVFAMLTLTYLSIALHGESGEAQGTML